MYVHHKGDSSTERLLLWRGPELQQDLELCAQLLLLLLQLLLLLLLFLLL